MPRPLARHSLAAPKAEVTALRVLAAVFRDDRAFLRVILEGQSTLASVEMDVERQELLDLLSTNQDLGEWAERNLDATLAGAESIADIQLRARQARTSRRDEVLARVRPERVAEVFGEAVRRP